MNFDVDFASLKPVEDVKCPQCGKDAICMTNNNETKTTACPYCQYGKTEPVPNGQQ